MRSHSAFTLLELLIVMILILVIVAMATPALQRVRARSELRSIAQKLQGELHATRLTAMKSGEAYLFRYQGQTGVYEILPKKVWDALNPEPQTAASLGPQSTRSVGEPLSQSLQSIQILPSGYEKPSGEQVLTHAYRKSLPGTVTFGMVKMTSDRNSNVALGPGSVRSVGETLNSSLTSSTISSPFSVLAEPELPAWSEPIFFFSNGRTSNGSLELLTLGNHRFRIDLTLRGLTGTARLGEIMVRE